GQGPLAALARRPRELEQDGEVGAAGEHLGDPGGGEREPQVGVGRPLGQRLAEARNRARVVADQRARPRLGDRPRDLLGRALLGDLAEDRADALGPAAERRAHRTQRVLVVVSGLLGVVPPRTCSGPVTTAAISARRSASRGSSARSSAAAVLRASLTEGTGWPGAGLSGVGLAGVGLAAGRMACSSRSTTRCNRACSWSPSWPCAST